MQQFYSCFVSFFGTLDMIQAKVLFFFLKQYYSRTLVRDHLAIKTPFSAAHSVFSVPQAAAYASSV